MPKQYHFKAIITDKRHKTLAIGENSYDKSHPYMYKLAMMHGEDKRIYLHAEIAAILKCPDLSKAKYIHVYRIRKSGIIEPVKPCHICASTIEAANLILMT